MSRFRSAYRVGEKICTAMLKHNFRAVITKVYLPSQKDEIFKKLAETTFFAGVSSSEVEGMTDEEKVEVWNKVFEFRDKDFDKNPIYLASSLYPNHPASFEEAKVIIPDLTQGQYDLLMGKKNRSYLFIETDIFPDTGGSDSE